MKKFVLHIIIVIGAIIIVDYLVGAMLVLLQNKSFEKNPKRFEFRAMYAIEKADDDILIVGASDASHSYISNVIEDSLNMTTYNLGKDGCFFIYQNCLINLMLERHVPRVILWEIGKNCLTASENEDREWKAIKDFYPYYRKSDYCKQLIDNRDKFQSIYMLSGLYRFNSSLLTIAEPFLFNDVVDDTANGYLPLPNEGYNYPEYRVLGKAVDNVDNEKIEILKGTLDKCKEKGIKVIFCFSPKFNSDNAEGTLQYEELKRIANQNEVSLIDYRNKAPFNTDATLFKDNAHLNDKGARLYMEYFIPELKLILSE